MKQFIAGVFTVVYLASAGAVQAQCGSSGKTKSLTTADGSSKTCGGFSDVMKELNLTEEQQQQIAELKSECDKSSCSKTGYDKYMTGLKEIMTAEQMEKCRTLCEQNGWKCPADKQAKAADSAEDDS